MSDLNALLDAVGKYHAVGWLDGVNDREAMDTRDPGHWPVFETHQGAYRAGFDAGRAALGGVRNMIEEADHA